MFLSLYLSCFVGQCLSDKVSIHVFKFIFIMFCGSMSQ